GDPAQVPPDHELRTAIALREALREVLLAHTGRAEPGAAAQDLAATRELDAIAARLPVRLEADAAGAVRPAPAGTGVEAGLAALLLIAAEAAATGTWTRLKVCGADDCRWAFYDRSPTRSGCWCSMAICGSRAKSRAFRRRSSIKAREPIQAGDLLPPCIAHKSPSKKVSGRLGWPRPGWRGLLRRAGGRRLPGARCRRAGSGGA
ncbi:MAG TPA: CGNR zinc finger domain-containing protein, partial [Streptosporangiaceae bacterium]